MRHGGGEGTLSSGATPDAVICEVRDRGRIEDPLAGRVEPAAGAEGGRGLWMANQLCDLVQIRSFAGRRRRPGAQASALAQERSPAPTSSRSWVAGCGATGGSVLALPARLASTCSGLGSLTFQAQPRRANRRISA